ncbi:MAG: hypothetical protein OXI94_14590 [Gemmatimonadota bacterium]|nr:hypothetical protein [Gemmatimonadota bacterium]MDE2953320.1 hypothetical protein [Gemmatimonadota bacterium]
MDNIMTVEEMRAQFESEWVLVENPQTNDALEVLKGKILHHSKDRDEVYRKAVTLRPKRSAIVYTGEIPEDTAVVL